MNPPPLPEDSRDTEQIRILVIFHYICAGLSCAGLLFLALHFFLMSSMVGLMEDLPSKVVVDAPVEVDAAPDPDAAPAPDLFPSEDMPLPSHEIDPQPELDSKTLKRFFSVFIYFYIAMGFYLLLIGLLNFMSARYLGQRRKKVFSIVTAGLNCLSIPLGTILGVFTIVVLSRQSVDATYRKRLSES